MLIPHLDRAAPAPRWMRLAVLAAALCPLASMATAQLTPINPDRIYYGIRQSIPVNVALPDAEPVKDGDAAAAAPEPVIDLYKAGTAQPVFTAPVVKGGVDLAALFPDIWATKTPGVLYAQLRVADKKIGSPLLLIPMTSPPRALLYNIEAQQAWFTNPKTGIPNFDARKQCELVYTTPPPPANYAGVRMYIERHVVFTTTLGEIEFRMRPDEAPNTSTNLCDLVKGGFFTEIPIHRIVPRLPSGHPFVVQFGDPTGTGDGGPGFNIQLENSKLPHDFGVLSMARDDDPDTNGSQVFICLSREGTARLDGKYTSFAQAVSGAEVIVALGSVKTDEKSQKPLEPLFVKSARLVPAPPYGTGPEPVKRPQPSGR